MPGLGVLGVESGEAMKFATEKEASAYAKHINRSVPMDRLVERLREYAGWAHYDELKRLLSEAANEIERLRAEKADLARIKGCLAQKVPPDTNWS